MLCFADDFRDTDRLGNQDASKSTVNTAAFCMASISHTYQLPDTTQEIEVEHSLPIVCSNEPDDRIMIDLPLLTIDTLGITEYDISRYRTITTLSPSYDEKLKAWEATYHEEVTYYPATEETVTTRPSITITTTDANGEKKTSTQYCTPEEHIIKTPERYISKWVYDYPRPEPTEEDYVHRRVYEPDSNSRIEDALLYVLKCRTRMGAIQNRLEHAYDNNQNKLENTTVAESVIRDTDMASEMVAYSNHNILLQVGQSMLSQTNKSPEYILQLLQS